MIILLLRVIHTHSNPHSAVLHETVICFWFCPQELSVGRQWSIKSKNKLYQKTMGQRVGLSFFDCKLADMAYCKRELQPLPLSPVG